MSFVCRRSWFLFACAVLVQAGAFAQTLPLNCCGDPPLPEGARPKISASGKRILRIAADPNNLPFSNERLEGFENKIAALLAEDLNAEIEWYWRAQRRGFFRETLKEGRCDLVMGVPAGFELGLPTKPYYRSSYVFITRKDRELKLGSLDDPALRQMKIGVQLIGDDGANPPAAHALARRGLFENLRGYSVYGDYAQPNPPAQIVEAVARGDVDTAVAWGPLAGYFAKHAAAPLQLAPITPEKDPPALRFAFSIAMATRKGDTDLKEQLDAFIARRAPEIARILDDYGVPRIPISDQPKEAHASR
jgi:mxaJ protein